MSREPALAGEIGGLFMVGLPGPAADDSTRRLIDELRINNFILFKRNAIDPDQVGALCQWLAESCQQAGLAPPLISIDQEGGSVTRLPEPFSQFPDMRILAEGPDPAARLTDYAQTCARELRAVGINMNLAPVLDVCAAGRNYFMERRVLGGEVKTVAEFGTLIIQGLQKNGVAACGKHFPGLGEATIDPHLHLPTVACSLTEIRATHLPPFSAAIAAGVAAIMTSHTIYSAIDGKWPATLSERILSGILRRELGFDGLIITDDLEMGAIENEISLEAAVVAILAAGADMLLICHDHDKVERAWQSVHKAVHRNVLHRQALAASLARIAKLRQNYA